MTDEQIRLKLFRMLYDAYPDNDLLPFDPDKIEHARSAEYAADHCGDPLFAFLYAELLDCWFKEDDLSPLVAGMESVRDQVNSVVENIINQIHEWGKQSHAQT